MNKLQSININRISNIQIAINLSWSLGDFFEGHNGKVFDTLYIFIEKLKM